MEPWYTQRRRRCMWEFQALLHVAAAAAAATANSTSPSTSAAMFAGRKPLPKDWWGSLPKSMQDVVSVIPSAGADASWRELAAPGGWDSRDNSRIEDPPGVLVVFYDAANFGGHTITENYPGLSITWDSSLFLPVQRMSMTVSARMVPTVSGMFCFSVRAGGPAAVYLITPNGESFLAVDAWETLSALDGKEEVPLELDGLSVARLFTDGPPIALQADNQYQLLVVHTTDELSVIGAAESRFVQVALLHVTAPGGDSVEEPVGVRQAIPSGWLRSAYAGGVTCSLYPSPFRATSLHTLIVPTFSAPLIRVLPRSNQAPEARAWRDPLTGGRFSARFSALVELPLDGVWAPIPSDIRVLELGVVGVWSGASMPRLWLAGARVPLEEVPRPSLGSEEDQSQDPEFCAGRVRWKGRVLVDDVVQNGLNGERSLSGGATVSFDLELDDAAPAADAPRESTSGIGTSGASPSATRGALLTTHHGAGVPAVLLHAVAGLGDSAFAKALQLGAVPVVEQGDGLCSVSHAASQADHETVRGEGSLVLLSSRANCSFAVAAAAARAIGALALAVVDSGSANPANAIPGDIDWTPAAGVLVLSLLPEAARELADDAAVIRIRARDLFIHCPVLYWREAGQVVTPGSRSCHSPCAELNHWCWTPDPLSVANTNPGQPNENPYPVAGSRRQRFRQFGSLAAHISTLSSSRPTRWLFRSSSPRFPPTSGAVDLVTAELSALLHPLATETLEIRVQGRGWFTLWIDNKQVLSASLQFAGAEETFTAQGSISVEAGRMVPVEISVDFNRRDRLSYWISSRVSAVLEWRSPSICESQAAQAKEHDGEKAFQTPQNCRFEPVPQRVLMPLPCSTGRISLGTFSSQTARASVDDLRPNPVTPLATYCVCPVDRVASTSSRHCRDESKFACTLSLAAGGKSKDEGNEVCHEVEASLDYWPSADGDPPCAQIIQDGSTFQIQSRVVCAFEVSSEYALERPSALVDGFRYAVVSADGAFAMQRAANLSLTMRAFNFARPSKSNILLQKVSLPSAAWKGDPSLLIVSSEGLDFGFFSGNRLYVEVSLEANYDEMRRLNAALPGAAPLFLEAPLDFAVNGVINSSHRVTLVASVVVTIGALAMMVMWLMRRRARHRSVAAVEMQDRG